jgi:hypothetical protein
MRWIRSSGGLPPGILIAVNEVPEAVPPTPIVPPTPVVPAILILDKLFGGGGA